MNKKTLTGCVLLLLSVPSFLVGLRDREIEQYNQWVIRQAQIAESQGLSYSYNLRPVLIGSSILFILSGIFLVSGIIYLYQGQLIEQHKRRG